MSAPSRIIRVSSTHKAHKEYIVGDIDYLTKSEAEEQLNHLEPGYSVLFFDSDKFQKKPGYFFKFIIFLSFLISQIYIIFQVQIDHLPSVLVTQG